EALQDVKQLADIIAAQHATSAVYEGTGTNTASVVSAGSGSVPPRPRRGVTIVGAALGVAGLARGGLLDDGRVSAPRRRGGPGRRDERRGTGRGERARGARLARHHVEARRMRNLDQRRSAIRNDADQDRGPSVR